MRHPERRDVEAVLIPIGGGGLASGVAILWGYSIAKFGIKKSMQHRRESKQLQELSEKLDRVDEDKRREVDDDRT